MFINVDMRNQPRGTPDPAPRAAEDLGAEEAAALLGVKLPTLYAYVSRGLLPSLPGARGRARRYRRADLLALRERGPERRAAAGALRWGEPILETSITAMTPEGPAYRGHPLDALLASRAGFEAVAELLWTGALAAAPVHWEPGPEPDLAPLLACLPPEAPHAACLPLLVAA